MPRRIGNTSEMKELWEPLLTRIQKRVGVAAAEYLKPGRPLGLTDENFIVSYSNEWRLAKAQDAANRLPLEQEINLCLDHPRKLLLCLEGDTEQI